MLGSLHILKMQTTVINKIVLLDCFDIGPQPIISIVMECHYSGGH